MEKDSPKFLLGINSIYLIRAKIMSKKKRGEKLRERFLVSFFVSIHYINRINESHNQISLKSRYSLALARGGSRIALSIRSLNIRVYFSTALPFPG